MLFLKNQNKTKKKNLIIPKLLYKLTNKKLKFFIKYYQNNFFIINWLKIYFFLTYQIQILKLNIVFNNKILFCTDIKQFKTFTKILAKKFNFFFAVGAWKCGILSNIYWYKFTPLFIINFGMNFPKTFFTELKTINIPNFYFYKPTSQILINTTLTYFIPTFSKKNQDIQNLNYLLLSQIYFSMQEKSNILLTQLKKTNILFFKYWKSLKKQKNILLTKKNKKNYISIFFELTLIKNIKNYKNLTLNFLKLKNIKEKINFFTIKKKKRIKKNWKTKIKQNIYIYKIINTFKKKILKKQTFSLKIQNSNTKINEWIQTQLFY